METISIIVPCFNEQETISIFFDEMNKVMNKLQNYQFEIVFIDDGSNDNTLNYMKTFHQKDNRYHYLSFSRNFGKEAAIYAGLQYVKGDYVAIMDVDLQDPPVLLVDMLQILKTENIDNVATKRCTRTGETFIRSFLSRNFYRVINKISSVQIVNGARDFRLMKRAMVDAILMMSERNRFSKGLFEWVGFKTYWIEFENVQRSGGQTKWSLKQLFFYSLEGISSFSVQPLFLSFILCGLLFLVFVVCIFYSFSLSLFFLFNALQLLCIGILGYYLSKMYIEIKHRPIYIVKERSEDHE
ncbi:glycosyltransferase family 2 protein [Floccifex sp.]|uniref:glycosyltransferase family 2 protein n=1 Tax=Floccifex sp. TaxID=2815810 RepID=UPI003F00E0A2